MKNRWTAAGKRPGPAYQMGAVMAGMSIPLAVPPFFVRLAVRSVYGWCEGNEKS